MKRSFRFVYKLAEKSHRTLIHDWLAQPYVAEWFYGQGLQNTIRHLDEFLNGASQAQYWLGFDKDHPFAFFITSRIAKSHDELTHWCTGKGDAITLDMLIGDTAYLGMGLAHQVIHGFLQNQFPLVDEVLIDPEKTNCRAVHAYQKTGFKIIDEFIPSHSPNPHYMMRLRLQMSADR